MELTSNLYQCTDRLYSAALSLKITAEVLGERYNKSDIIVNQLAAKHISMLDEDVPEFINTYTQLKHSNNRFKDYIEARNTMFGLLKPPLLPILRIMWLDIERLLMTNDLDYQLSSHPWKDEYSMDKLLTQATEFSSSSEDTLKRIVKNQNEIQGKLLSKLIM